MNARYTLIHLLLLVLICLMFLGPISLIILGNNSCSILLPHDHVLLGSASERDLMLHLLYEQQCRYRVPHTMQTDQLKANARVLSVTRNDLAEIGKILSANGEMLHTVSLRLRAPVNTLIWSVEGRALQPASFMHPPPVPPPIAI